MAQMVAHMLSKYKALSSTPSTTKKQSPIIKENKNITKEEQMFATDFEGYGSPY
jgi:hypothetical protein